MWPLTNMENILWLERLWYLTNYAHTCEPLYHTLLIISVRSLENGRCPLPNMHYIPRIIHTVYGLLWLGTSRFKFIHIVHRYSDGIISAMASQITCASSVCSSVCSGADQRNIKAPRHWPLWGESTGDRWFPSQRASNTENVSISRRHHDDYLTGTLAMIWLPRYQRRNHHEYGSINCNTKPTMLYMWAECFMLKHM